MLLNFPTARIRSCCEATYYYAPRLAGESDEGFDDDHFTQLSRDSSVSPIGQRSEFFSIIQRPLVADRVG